MAQTIKLRRSSTSGAVPTTSSLSLGEVAINTYDGKMYIKKNDGTDAIVELSGDKLPLSGGTLTGTLNFGDDVRARFGASNDLQIYHNGNSSYIRDVGEGNLYIDTNGARISLISDGSYSNGKMADFVKDGAVILYHDNSEKLQTTSTGINVTGSVLTDGLAVNSGGTSSNLSIRNGSNTSFLNIYSDLNGVAILDVDGANVGAAPRFQIDVGNVQTFRITEGGDISFYDGSGNQGLFWDSSASSLGIGTTAVSSFAINDLVVGSGSSVHGMTIYTGTSHEGIIRFADGTSGAQQYAGQVKYNHSNNSLNFYTNGSATIRLALDSSGNATFSGSVTATNTILNTGSTTVSTILRGGDGNSKNLVFQKTTGSAQQAKISAVGDDLRFTTGPTTERMRIDSSGNVGIGTTSPTARLDVRSPNGGVHSRGQLYLTNTDSHAINQGSQISLGGTYSGTGDTYLGSIAARKENATSGDYAGYLQFGTRPSGAANVERMRITSIGRVGIGTAAPEDRLHISGGNILLNNALEIRTKDTGGNLRTIMRANSSNELEYGWSANAPVKFMGGGSYTERMRIHTDGNVGIGTTSPDTKLDLTSSGVHGLILNEDTGNSSASSRLFFKSAQRTNTILNVSGNLEFRTGATINSTSGTIRMTIIGSSGAIRFNEAFTFPTTDGSANQLLQTDGSGNMSWATVAGVGNATIISDADNNTKIQVEESADENKIRFDTAGTQRMLLDNAGKLAVGGNQTPAYPLDLRNPSDSNQIFRVLFPDSSTVQIGTSRMAAGNTQGLFVEGQTGVRFGVSGIEYGRFHSNGNFGLGTTAPAAKLHIVGSAIIDGGTGVASTGVLHVRQSGDTLNNGIALTSSHSTSHRIWKDSAGKLNFGPTSLPSAFVQDLTGKVGIGTTSPSHLLHVTGADGSIANMVVNNDNVALRMSAYTNSHGEIRVETNHPLLFKTNGNNERMRVTNTGNVGIGETAPLGKLHIKSADAGSITPNSNHDDLIIEGSGNTGINIFSGTSSYQYLAFGDSGGSNRGYVRYHHGSDQMVLRAGGTDTVHINGNGNVGIGTTSPNNKLTVTGGSDGINIQGTSSYLRWNSGDMMIRNEGSYAMGFHTYDGSSVQVERMRITSAGNIGIGTTAPIAKLDVNGSINVKTATTIALSQDTTSTTALLIPRGTAIRSNTDDGYQRTLLSHLGTTGNGAIQIGQQGTAIITDILMYPGSSGNIRFFPSGTEDIRFTSAGKVGIGTTAPYYTLDTRFSNTTTTLSDGSSGNWGSNGIRIDNTNTTVGAMALAHFRVGDADWHIGNKRVGTDQADFIFANEGVTKMLIDHTGNVGIGTDAPEALLHIKAADTVTGVIKIEGGKSTVTSLGEINSQLDFGSNDASVNGTGQVGGRIASVTENANGAYTGMAFSTFTQSGSPNLAEKVRITYDGKVGIGTTTPAVPLHVQGWARLVGSLQLSATNAQVTNIANSSLLFGTNNTEKMRITAAGNVGIGITDPTNTDYGSLIPKLHVKQSGTTGAFNLVARFQAGSDAEATGGAILINHSNDRGMLIEGGRDGSGSAADDDGVGHLGILTSGGAHTRMITLRQNMVGASSVYNVGIGTTAPQAKLQVEELGINTTTTSTAAVTQVAIDSMVAATFRSARYTIQVTNSTDSTYHLTEMLLIHDGTTPSISEFGTIFTGSAAEAVFTADISSGNVRILATPASADAMAFKVVRHSITV